MAGTAEGRQAGGGSAQLKPLVLGTSRLRLAGLALGCGAFTAAGLFLLLADGWAGKLAGLAAILFFGLGGAWAVWKKARDRAVLTLTQDGIRVHAGGFLSWEDFESAGMGRIPGAPGGTGVLGIRMKSLERYAASLTPAQVRLARAAAKAGKLAGGALPEAAVPYDRSGSAALRALPQHDVPDMLRWNRELSGWDVSFSPLLFDGGSAAALEKIHAYHRAVLDQRYGRTGAGS